MKGGEGYLQEYGSIQMFCPNCGHKTVGRLLKSGAVSIQCKRCYCVLVGKKMRGKNGYIIKVKTTQ